jgi:dTDP-4-amino-4,6-dideoxygalactose transaminase
MISPSGDASFLPFHRPWIDADSIQAVVRTLESGWITRGPETEAFEKAFAEYLGCRAAIGLNSCTAGLHLSLVALGIGAGDEVITSPITFPATANVIVHQGATPVFADVEPDTLNLDPAQVAARITPRTKAIMPVHFAGHPCPMAPILELAERHRLHVIEDAAHAIEASESGRKIGAIGQLTAFSFYATKNLTTGEGGMLTTDDPDLAERIRILSLHGISKSAWTRYTPAGVHEWETLLPGFKYNMFDIQAALGLAQLARLEDWWQIRRSHARRYQDALCDAPQLTLLGERPGIRHAHHLFVVLLELERLRVDRRTIMELLRARGIGTGVHFTSLHLHPYYRSAVVVPPGELRVAEWASPRVLSLPLYPRMSEGDVDRVAATLRNVLAAQAR